jgi:hypothetical protein
MAKIGVKLKIDVTNIEKARLFKGKKGTYLDATAFIDVDNKDQYDNNGMITQDVTKEEKNNGVKGAILGNVQVFWREEQQRSQPATTVAQVEDDFNDDIPF